MSLFFLFCFDYVCIMYVFLCRINNSNNNDKNYNLFCVSWQDYSILNSTVSSRDSVLSPTVTKYDIRMALTRNDKSIVYEHERIFSPKELNETVTIGFEKMEKTLKPSFEAYRDWTFLSKSLNKMEIKKQI